MKQKICPKCGSSKVIPNLPIADHAHGGGIMPWAAYISDKPHALFRKIHFFKIRAWICGECGYTELYASEPDKIVSAYQQYLDNKQNRKK